MKVWTHFQMTAEEGDVERITSRCYWFILSVPAMALLVPHPFGVAILAAVSILMAALTVGTAMWVRSERDRTDGIEAESKRIRATAENLDIDVRLHIADEVERWKNFRITPVVGGEHIERAVLEMVALRIREQVSRTQEFRASLRSPPHGTCDCDPPP